MTHSVKIIFPGKTLKTQWLLHKPNEILACPSFLKGEKDLTQKSTSAENVCKFLLISAEVHICVNIKRLILHTHYSLKKIQWQTTYRWQSLIFSRACSFFLQLVGLQLPLMSRCVMQGVRKSCYHLPSTRNQRFPFHWMMFNSAYQLFHYNLASRLYVIASALYIALLIFFFSTEML